MISKGLDFTSFVYLMTLTSYKPTEEKEINDDIKGVGFGVFVYLLTLTGYKPTEEKEIDNDIKGVGFHIICLLNDTYQL